jgi:hypothetical protein
LEKKGIAKLVSNLLKVIARKLVKGANFADNSPNCSPMLKYVETDFFHLDTCRTVADYILLYHKTTLT